jgi:phospholipase C
VRPFADHADANPDAPHNAEASREDINGGKMNGFVRSMARTVPLSPTCDRPRQDQCAASAMGYHTKSDIPNYWSYARDFVLFDRWFASVASWSLPAHFVQVSGWSAICSKHNKPSSCKNSLDQTPWMRQIDPTTGRPPNAPIAAWTDITYLLHKAGVSWGSYFVPGLEPDCDEVGSLSCVPRPVKPSTPSGWNVLPLFDTVQNDNEAHNVQGVQAFYDQAKAGTLPAVSWVFPSFDNSEHGPALVSSGQSFVTSLVNAVMRGPDWKSSAIVITWDEWGGMYDHVRPPRVDANGFGIRVPSLLISPYARPGRIDHQTLSVDADLKLIEDLFLKGRRLDPKTDGRPDPRPTVREDVSILGDLRKAFDFEQKPRSPMVLPVHPATTLHKVVPYAPDVRRPVPGKHRVTVSWRRSSGDGGFEITEYQVLPRRNGVAQGWRSVPADDRRDYSYALSGLRGGDKYSFDVRAVNRLGAGIVARTATVRIGK